MVVWNYDSIWDSFDYSWSYLARDRALVIVNHLQLNMVDDVTEPEAFLLRLLVELRG